MQKGILGMDSGIKLPHPFKSGQRNKITTPI